MKHAESSNKQRKFSYLGAAALLLAALATFGVSLKVFNNDNKPDGFWYLDTETGKLFLGDTKALPPIASPSGGRGMLAHVYGCDRGCGKLDLEGKTLKDLEALNLFVSHLERVSEEGLALAKQAKNNATGKITPDAAAYIATMEHHVIMILDGPNPKWVRPSIETTRIITQMLQTHCGDAQAQPCIPGRS